MGNDAKTRMMVMVPRWYYWFFLLNAACAVSYFSLLGESGRIDLLGVFWVAIGLAMAVMPWYPRPASTAFLTLAIVGIAGHAIMIPIMLVLLGLLFVGDQVSKLVEGLVWVGYCLWVCLLLIHGAFRVARRRAAG